MSIYLLAKKARMNNQQKVINAVNPFSLNYTGTGNLKSCACDLPSVPYKQKSYDQYLKKRYKQYIEPNHTFKRKPDFSSSQYIDNKKSRALQDDCNKSCYKDNCSSSGNAEMICGNYNDSCSKGRVFWTVHFGNSISTGTDGSLTKNINEFEGNNHEERIDSIRQFVMRRDNIWNSFYIFQETMVTFTNGELTAQDTNYVSHTRIVEILPMGHNYGTNKKPVITKDLLFKSSSEHLAKKKANRVKPNQPYESMMLFNRNCNAANI